MQKLAEQMKSERAKKEAEEQREREKKARAAQKAAEAKAAAAPKVIRRQRRLLGIKLSLKKQSTVV